MGGFKGGAVRVTVGKKRKVTQEELLALKVRAIMLGRKVTDVQLRADQLVFKLDDGGSVSMNCTGGLKEVS